MRKLTFWFVVILGTLCCTANLLLLFFFGATTVDLSPQEEAMLTMTSNQINSIYTMASTIFMQLNNTVYDTNTTSNLIYLRSQLELLIAQHELNVGATTDLANLSNETLESLLLFNTTIEPTLAPIGDAIANVTLPASLNLTISQNETTVQNGTVTLSNPNNSNENVTVPYRLQSNYYDQQLYTLHIDPVPFTYTTLGANNWLTLESWAPSPFPPVMSGTFAPDVMLDAQRDKISMVGASVTRREYDPVSNEMRLMFSAPLAMAQTISIVEPLTFSVALI